MYELTREQKTTLKKEILYAQESCDDFIYPTDDMRRRRRKSRSKSGNAYNKARKELGLIPIDGTISFNSALCRINNVMGKARCEAF